MCAKLRKGYRHFAHTECSRNRRSVQTGSMYSMYALMHQMEERSRLNERRYRSSMENLEESPFRNTVAAGPAPQVEKKLF